MTATPHDPFAKRTDSLSPEPQPESSSDAQTQHLRAENRALRALLAAQVQPFEMAPEPGRLRRFAWWLLSAPGAMLVGWRRWFGLAETSRPFSGKRVGYTALTVLYTLAIYGGLVLLVVYWSTPRYAAGDATLTSASPVRVPLPPSNSTPNTDALARYANRLEAFIGGDEASTTTAHAGDTKSVDQDVQTAPHTAPPAPTPYTDSVTLGAAGAARSADTDSVVPASNNVPANAAAHAPPPEKKEPRSVLRITEIPAVDPKAWIKELQSALNQCAALSFLERPDCVAKARKQYCQPNAAWGAIRECPANVTP